ncbi:E3 ubiquitin-protein ligase TRAIP-like [Xenia sp. Carnegie-2017]|uniref:E3 ubiquitin-protein ligase TRAIP-like n=1 Tax=Xenia sp. Carnegie-2017 TaxID=2897299 RepID=UPI001F0494AC|nr:E3 ubiquitin-protein ligase TRAIP-like [Xenia sp. Carnegie-2017]
MPEWPCTICTEPLAQAELSACPCGHVYHYHCLERWLQRSNSCPTCRKRTTSGLRLFFSNEKDFSSSGAQNGNDSKLITEQLRKQKALTLEKDNEIKTLKESLHDIGVRFDEYCERNETLKREFDEKSNTVDSLKKQVKFLTEKTKRMNQLEKQLESMRVNLSHLERFQVMIEGTRTEVDDLLKTIGTSPKTARELAAQVTIMKHENKKFQEAKDKARNEKAQIEKDYNSLRHQLISKDVECRNLRKKLETQDDQLNEIEEEKKHLKKKVDKMKESFDTESPRSTLINRLLQESPVPIKLDENISFSSHTVSNKEESERKEGEVSKIEFASPVYPGAYLKRRKRSYANLENTGRMRRGYNGLGGRSTVLLPFLGNSQTKKARKVSRPQNISKFVRTKSNQPLPSM